MIAERAAELFLEARTLDPDTRDQFVADQCGADDNLAREVHALLAASGESEDYFGKLADKVSLGALAQVDEPGLEDKLFGSWRVLKQIGRGGMGAVYMAERADEQFEQKGALKVLPKGLDSAQARARFLIERQILARLVHDNIARLLDGGVSEDGAPYFVMDFVEGLPIDEFCEKHALSVEDRLSLVLDISRAVQFAHRNLVIHRDLKPSNVLVTDGRRVRLLDFGIAKLVEPDGIDASLTQVSQRPATPAFASPEMLRGEPVDVTTDVYSIGALMFVLLTGRPPIDYDGLTLAEMHERAASEMPPSVSQFNPKLKGDVDTIVAKALAKSPADRYESVESLGNDVRNFLGGLPVAAKTPSAMYRARKFLVRHRTGAVFTAFAIVALAAIAVLAVRSAVISDRQAQEIALERDRAQATKEFLVSIFDSADPNVAPGNLTAREILEAGRERIDAELVDQPAVQADLLESIGIVYMSWRLIEEGTNILEQERALRASTDGEESAEYANVLSRLAAIADIGGDYEAALEYATSSLGISERVGDLKGQSAAHERIGRMAHLQGDFDSADTHYSRSLELLYQAGRAGTQSEAVLHEHRGNLLNHRQQYEESLLAFEKSLQLRRKFKSGDSSLVSPIYLGMGSVLNKLGRYDEAFETYQAGYDMNDRLYGAGNSYNLFFVNGLGKVAEARGDLDNAMANYEESRRLIVAHTPESPNLAFANANVGKVHSLQGRFDLALPFYRTAEEIMREKLPGHWKLGEVRWRLGRCFAEAGDFDAAEPLILDGIEIVTVQWGPDHESSRNARAAAVRLYESWEKPEKAEAFR
jgi:serine/threonine-protein kinase